MADSSLWGKQFYEDDREMKLNIEKIIPNLRIHTIIDESLIASYGYKIYSSKDYGKTWIFCNKLPVRYYKQFISKNRMISRLLRMGISQIKQILGDKLLICCIGNIFLSDLSFSYFTKVDIPIRFFQLLDHSICVTPEYIYYGEYFPNLKRKEVNIFRSKNGLDWEIVYSFPEKSIKHIHVLQYDTFLNKIWFSTGDADNECILGFADLNFSNLTIIGKGDQKWRTLEFVFSEDNVIWGMDAPLVQSKLISYNRKSKTVEEIYDFNGPIYNIKKLDKGFIVGTATEGGKGEKYNKAYLCYSSNLLDWSECISYEKDVFPNIFGFGRLLLCDGMKENIFFSGSSLKEIDNKLVLCKIEEI
jgi:hypothetical protein